MFTSLGARPPTCGRTAARAVAFVAAPSRRTTSPSTASTWTRRTSPSSPRSGATVVLCPRSNRYIGGRLPPVAALLAAGVPLAIGTDSLASCPSLAPLADLALLRRELPEIPAGALLPLAWNGAAVGAPHVGALVPGKAPGVLAAPLRGARRGSVRLRRLGARRRGAPVLLARAAARGGPRMTAPTPLRPAPPAPGGPIAALARMVKLSHSLFALPFAASGGRARRARRPARALAARARRGRGRRGAHRGDGDEPDRRPRVRREEPAHRAAGARDGRGLRPPPRGRSSPGAAPRSSSPPRSSHRSAGGSRCRCSPILLGYSYAKRFTWACHLWLGVAQALAPIGVAIALTGEAPLAAVVLGLGVGAWIAGFDVFYSLQDMDYDRGAGSRPSRRASASGGRSRGRARLHVLAVAGVAAAGALGGRGAGWLVGTVVLGAVVAAEHVYVAPRGRLRPERIDVAFFNYNAFASIAFALCALADLALA